MKLMEQANAIVAELFQVNDTFWERYMIWIDESNMIVLFNKIMKIIVTHIKIKFEFKLILNNNYLEKNLSL